MNSNKELKMYCNKGVYGLEITTTNSCSFNCVYCFESNYVHKKNLLNDKIIIERVNQLLNSSWFNKQYCGIKIILWGGEPTLNMSLCKSLMEEFKDNERVAFFVYTNGSNIDKFISTLVKLNKKPFVKKDVNKITVQVSYDGNPLHDMNRKTIDGNTTSKIVLYAISTLNKFNINYGLKGTLTWKDYKYITNSWDDFKFLHENYGSKIRYALTVDYYNIEFTKYKKVIEEKLVQIAQREIKFFKKYGYFLSNIFRSNKSICSTGKSMAVVDTNGDVYNCHGSIYSKCSNDLKYSNIFNENFINNIKERNKLYKNNQIEPNECIECIAGSCLRCNVKKYEESKKKTHLDRWYDYSIQKDLCKYYKLVGKISSAIESIINIGD